MSSVIFRISAATILLGVVGTSVVPYVTSYVATSAVVNAPVVAVRAPFDGIIVTPSHDFADAVVAADLLIDMRNSVDQLGQVLSLATSRDAVSGEIAGIQAQIQTYHGLQVSLTARREAEINARLAWFTPRLKEAEAQITLTDTNHTVAAATYARVSRLEALGLVNIDTITAAETELTTNAAQLQTQQATYARLLAERDALAAIIGVDLISTNLEQINARLDEVSMRVADLEARLLERQTLHLGLESQIAALMAEAKRQENFTPTASIDGLIWQASAKAGASVTAGETVMTVLDCSRRFLEVVLPERHFERITTGTRANVRLIGASETFDATVVAAYGSGARSNSDMRAAHTQIEATNGFLVIVTLDDVDVNDQAVAESFCDVGRTAEVHFDLPRDNIFTSAKSMLVSLIPWQRSDTSHDIQAVAIDLGAN